jgi:hypothetical protein
VADLAPNRKGGDGASTAGRKNEEQLVTAGHFIFIPAVLLVGIVIGWILGSRAARDAYLAELQRRDKKDGLGKVKEG